MGGVGVRVAVVGASGNIGTALLRRLADDGDVEVVGVARRRPPDVAPYHGVTWHTTDVGRADATAALRTAFRDADAVVHLAWGFQPTRRPDHLEQVGVGGTSRVVEAVADAGVHRLVHMSSVGAYAPRTDLTPVDEGYPVTSVPGSTYSRHKAAAEALLDRAEHRLGDAVRIARLRPGFVLQRDAGASLARYGLPVWLPRPLLGRLPLVPLPTGLVIPAIATPDVADAIARVVRTEDTGAFNLAADPAVTAADIAGVLGGRAVPVPRALGRAVVSGAWWARLQPIDAGWYDLALQVPLIDSSRARDVLGWSPRVDAREALAEAIAGIAAGDGVGGRVLGPRRSAADVVATWLRAGRVSRRRAT